MSIKKTLKKFMGLSIVSIMAVGLISCGEKNEEVVSAMGKNEIIIGVDDAFPPMGFRENGEIVGFDIDLAKEVFAKLGKDIKVQNIDWTMKETELKNKNIDVIWNGYTITEGRKEQVDFTPAYLENRQVIVTLAESDIKTKKDLEGKKVAAQADSSAIDAMEKEAELYAKLDGGQAITFSNNDMVLRDLEAGRVDAVVMDEVVINYYIAKKEPGKLRVLEENFGEEEYGIGVRKGDKELLDGIIKALNELKEEGRAEEISKKWFGENKLVY